MTRLHKDEKLLWQSQSFAKDLLKKDNLGSKPWGRGFLIENILIFKNSLVDFDRDQFQRPVPSI